MWFLQLFRWFFKPSPISKLELWGFVSSDLDPDNYFYFNKEKNMKVARVEATWTPSVSADVVSQTVVVMNETIGSGIFEQTVSAEADSVMFEIPEKNSVTITVSAFDGTYTSDPASYTFMVEDLTKPLPPASVFATIVEVIDTDTVVDPA
tara:strand:- start:67 stop:516 length:450 start_codon:yes stop_codon:yes gene_type:complete